MGKANGVAKTKKASRRGRTRKASGASSTSSARASRRRASAVTKEAGKTQKGKTARKKSVRAGKKTHLSRKELNEFRQILEHKRRLLVGDLSGMRQQAAQQKGGGNLSSMPTHMADVGTDNFEHEFTLGLLESEQALLEEIEEALARIQEGTYGVCLGTGKPIPKARLRAKPWAKYTVEYTRLLEKGLVRPPEESEREEEEQEDEDQEASETEEDDLEDESEEEYLEAEDEE